LERKDAQASVGDAGRLRPHRSDSDEEAKLTPLGKRASWSGNQLTHTKIATMYTKTAFSNKKLFNKQDKDIYPYPLNF